MHMLQKLLVAPWSASLLHHPAAGIQHATVAGAPQSEQKPAQVIEHTQ